VSVRLFVTSRCSTETAKRRIAQTTPHDSPGFCSFCCRQSLQNSNGVTANGGAKCRWGRLNAGEVAENWRLSITKRCQLSLVASLSHKTSTCTFAVMQRVARVCQRQLILVYMVGLRELSFRNSLTVLHGWW